MEYLFYAVLPCSARKIAEKRLVLTRLSLRDLCIVLLVVTIWGFAFVPIRWALDAVPPFALAALRFLFAAIPAVFFVPRPRVSARTLVAYGFAIGVFQFGLLFLGMRLGMAAGLSSLVIQVQVFLTIGIAAGWLNDRLTRQSLIGAAIAAAGIVVLGAQKVAAGAGSTFIGFLLVIASALAWAVGNVIAKRAAGKDEVDMLGMVVWSSLAAPLPLFLASFAFEGGAADVVSRIVHMGVGPWACVIFMSYFPTLYCLVNWNKLLHRYPTAVIAPFALLIPVAGLVSSALLLGESLAPVQFAGAALVLAGLAWNVLGAQARQWIAEALD
jgi:O-acetylserine/cysteine efflux transporter